MYKHIKTMALAALLVIIIAFLPGCAKKPPGCADPQTLETIRSLTVENAQKDVLPSPGYEHPFADDPQGLVAKFYKEMKIELTNVVSNGYSSDARKYSCQGQLTVTTLNGNTLARAIEYSTQVTESPESSFVVKIQDYGPFIRGISGNLRQYYQRTRFVGEWRGEYSCGGIDGAQDGPQGPFSMPVALQSLETGEVRLERTTKGGGIEKLRGVRGDTIRLQGSGQNSPDDTWNTTFNGVVKGMEYAATGQIVTPEGRVLRQCTLKLALPSIQ